METPRSNRHIGAKGEQIAADFLTAQGYHIIERNPSSRWGEIDIIARKEDTLVFVEVKTRVGDGRGKPYEAVTHRKLLHVFRAAQFYLMTHRNLASKYSVDVVSVVLRRDESVQDITHFPNITA